MFGLTANEALLVCDTIGGNHLSRYATGSRPLEYLVSDVEGQIRMFQLERRWNADPEKVLAKLRVLDLEQRRLLTAAVERFWELSSRLGRERALLKSGLIDNGALSGRLLFNGSAQKRHNGAEVKNAPTSLPTNRR